VVAGLVFLLVEVLYYGPALAGEAVLSPAAVIYEWPPWRPFAPPDLADYNNPLLSDHAREFYPWLDYARERFRSGEIPQWNPYTLAGAPFLANPGAAIFSPFNVPVWILPLKYGLGVAAALKLWVAAFGTYLLARELRLGFWPALVAGLAFGFAPFTTVWLSHTHVNVVVLAPLALLGVERLVARGKPVDAVVLAGILVAALLGGHPGSQIHLYGAAALYALVRLAAMHWLSPLIRFLRLALVAVALALALAVAAFALLPAALLVADSAGLETHQSGGAVRPLTTLRTLVFPDWWGRPSSVALPDDPSNFNERTLYVGVIPLLLGLSAVLHRREWRKKLPFALLAFLGLAIPLGLQPFEGFFAHVPPFERVINSRLIVFADLGFALLGAFGIRELLTARRASKRALALAGAGVATGLVAAISVDPSAAVLRATARHFLTGTDYAWPRVLELTTIAWWTAFALALVALLAFARRLRPVGAAILLAGLVVADLGHFGHGYQPLAPAEHVFGVTPPAIRWLQRNAGSDRVAAFGRHVLLADTAMVYRLRDIRGYDAPLPKLDYARFFYGRSGVAKLRLFIRAVTPEHRRALDLLSVRYLLAGPQASEPAEGFSLVYEGRDGRVFENERSLARAHLPARIRVRGDSDSAWATLAGPGFDTRTDAVVEASGDVTSAVGSVRFTGDEPSRVELSAELERGGLVALTDSWAPGWRVSVDGQAERPLRVNTVSRGVIVPAGTHRIVWTYRAEGLATGLWISGAGAGVILAWLGWILRVRRRARAA
jgi:hypothetical protein